MKEISHEQFGGLLDMSPEELQEKHGSLKKSKSRKVKRERHLVRMLLTEQVSLWRSRNQSTAVIRNHDSNGTPFEIIHKTLGEEITHEFKTFSGAIDTAKWLCDEDKEKMVN